MKIIYIIFLLLLFNFLLILALLFISPLQEMLHGSQFLIPFITLFILGFSLTLLTRKLKQKTKLKKCLFLTGISAMLLLIGSVLHNFFYALEILTKNIPILPQLMSILHVFFFLTAFPISPILFLIGAVKTSLLFLKTRSKSTS